MTDYSIISNLTLQNIKYIFKHEHSTDNLKDKLNFCQLMEAAALFILALV